MVLPIGVGGLPKKTTYLKPVKQKKRDDSVAYSVAVGQKVYHKEYGNGIVESVDAYAYEFKVRFKKVKELQTFIYPDDFVKGVLK